MNLFIDTPQRSAERMERRQLLREADRRETVRRVADAPEPDLDLDEVPGCESPRRGGPQDAAGTSFGPQDAAGTSFGPLEPTSVAADAYREEKAFDRKRRRRRARGRVLRVFALIILAPIAIVAVFLISYALTCILNGASPDELVDSFANLFVRIEGVLFDLGLLPIH